MYTYRGTHKTNVQHESHIMSYVRPVNVHLRRLGSEIVLVCHRAVTRRIFVLDGESPLVPACVESKAVAIFHIDRICAEHLETRRSLTVDPNAIGRTAQWR